MNNEKLRNAIAATLRAIRGEKSQEEFAKICGLTQGQISQYESGRALPGMQALIQIRRATGCDLNELAGIARKFETKEEGRG